MADGQLPGKGRATRKRRAQDNIPRTMIANRFTHLPPALFTQGIVDLAAIFSSSHGFAMAHQIKQRGNMLSRHKAPDTPASAKVAI